jgi:glucose-6-phosphate 1-epimerase
LNLPAVPAQSLPVIQLSHPSGAAADIDLLGATVLSWRPPGAGEMLFMSRSPQGANDGPLRGGIPVIFPQFAELGPLPLHGLAHSQPWQCVAAEPAQATLRLADTAVTRASWPHAFEAELSVALTASCLAVGLSVRNAGRAPFDFCAGLHTYLQVGDVERARLRGVAGAAYEERGSPGRRTVDAVADLSIAGPLDRIYVGLQTPLQLDDPVLARAVTVSQSGFADVVIWNPGAESKTITPFLQAGEYRRMLCVEAAQVISPIRLAPGAHWRGAQTLELVRADGSL